MRNPARSTQPDDEIAQAREDVRRMLDHHDALQRFLALEFGRAR